MVFLWLNLYFFPLPHGILCIKVKNTPLLVLHCSSAVSAPGPLLSLPGFTEDTEGGVIGSAPVSREWGHGLPGLCVSMVTYIPALECTCVSAYLAPGLLRKHPEEGVGKYNKNIFFYHFKLKRQPYRAVHMLWQKLYPLWHSAGSTAAKSDSF